MIEESKPSSQADSNALVWRTFAIQMFLGLLASIAIVPYLIEIDRATGKQSDAWELAASTVLEQMFLLAVAICMGLILGPKVGIGTPFLNDSFSEPPERPRQVRSSCVMALASGVGVAIVIAIADPWLAALLPEWPESARRAEQAAENIAAWKSLLAFFSAGVTEELLFRFGLMTLLAWLGAKLARRKVPGPLVFWAANLLSAFVFGLAHLSNAVQLGIPVTQELILYVAVTNGFGGVVFGWLYCRQGLMAAIIAHFAADVVLKIAVPMVTAALA